MKRNPITMITLLVSLSLCLSLPAVSAEVSDKMAQQVANQAISSYFPAGGGHRITSSHQVRSTSSSIPIYIFELAPQGFILVSGDDRYPPLLGFSWESTWYGKEERVSSVRELTLDNLAKQIQPHQENDQSASSKENPWTIFKSLKSQPSTKTSVAPLLNSKWKLDNSFCAMFPTNSMANASAVIAMGQLFRFYKMPVAGSGAYCYNHAIVGEICQNFNNWLFEFDSMPANSANTEVQMLLKYLSVAGHLQPSGCSLNTFKETLPTHFGYSQNMRKLATWEYDSQEALLYQLSLHRPVPADWGDYSFVIDGHLGPDYFHFNMGMGGDLDGYYLIDFPQVTVVTSRTLLNLYVNYHPASLLPKPQNLLIANEGDQFRISWTINLPDSMVSRLSRYVLLRDGVIPITQTNQQSVLLDATTFGISSRVSCMADFGTTGWSELSNPYLFITDQTVVEIPSIPLRQAINIKLGYGADLHRHPFAGELELIKEITVDFADQRGLEKFPQLKSLIFNGTGLTTLRSGEYLGNLSSLRFTNTKDVDLTIFNQTRSLNYLYGYDGIPYDLYDFRHNTHLLSIFFSNHGALVNACADLYKADKYFPEANSFYLYHLTNLGGYDNCWVSYESWNDFIPLVKYNQNLFAHTHPSSFVPCYPVPAREVNVKTVNQISWQSNFTDDPAVFYNIFIGNNRNDLALTAVFQTTKSVNYNFLPNKEYYWRVEAYHTDTVYYSGIFSFTTWQTMPMPFVETFDRYFGYASITDESPWWITFDSSLTGRATTDPNIKRNGNYSLGIRPKSDAGIILEHPGDSVFTVDFWIRNQRGEIGIEILQATGDTVSVNARASIYGTNLGTFNFGDGIGNFNYLPNEWNHVSIVVNPKAALADFKMNDVIIKQWYWNLQVGGATNTGVFKGIRFVNTTGLTGGSAFIDDLFIMSGGTLSIDNLPLDQLVITFLPQVNILSINGIPTNEIAAIHLTDLQGKILRTAEPVNAEFQLPEGVQNGIYLLVLSTQKGQILTKKIAIFK